MRTAFLVSALAALAVAAPRPQEMDIDEITVGTVCLMGRRAMC